MIMSTAAAALVATVWASCPSDDEYTLTTTILNEQTTETAPVREVEAEIGLIV